MADEKAKAGASEKPAETTVKAAGQPAEAPSTHDAVASLLMREFGAGEEEKPKPGAEAQPGEAETDEPEPTEGTESQGGEGEKTPEERAAEAIAGKAEEEPEGAQLTPEVQAIVDKRIGKVVAQREEEKKLREKAEERAAELEAENAQLKTTAGPPGPQRPAYDEKGIEQLERQTDQFVREAEAVLDDSATPAEKARIEAFMAGQGMDAAGLKRFVREANALLTREIPRQRHQLAGFRQNEAQVEPVVKKHFGWLDDKKSPEYAMAQKILAIVPELTSRTPAHRVALGIYVLGLKEFEKLGKAAAGNGQAAAKPAVKAPPKPPAGGAPAGARNRNSREDSARAEFAKAPSREKVTELLKAVL